MKLNIFILTLLIIDMNSEFYSSMDKLADVHKVETSVLNDFENILLKVNDMKSYLETKLLPWIAEHKEAENDTSYLTNSLNAFLLLKLNVHDLKMVSENVKNFADDLIKIALKVEEKSIVPVKELIGAVGGFLRAQKAYQLKSEDLVEGIVEGVKTRKPLSPHDIFVFGDSVYGEEENAFFMKNYLEIARKKVENGEDILAEVDLKKIDEALQELPEEILDPFDETYEKTRSRRTDIVLVQKACRGNLTRTPKETKDLFCRMVSNSPFSLIGPFKLEEVSLEPHLVIYHDVLSDSEVNRLIEIARQNQSRAMLLGDAETFDEDRLAQVMWMKKHLYPKEAAVLDARFEDMTGLSMESAEPLQIQNYGVGGHYYPHYDAFGAGDDLDGSKPNRVATLMLYLSDVEKGGATAFPFLKTKVIPKKGSAVFWYNLKHSGHHEPYSLHSGCPILIGNKWVANKWIQNSVQMFHKPCKPVKFVRSKTQNEIYEKFKEN